MPPFVLGLPTHALVLHAAVVLLPLTALLVVLAAFSDAVRRRAGALVPAAGALSLALVPAATTTGEQLMARLPPDPATTAHQRAGEDVLPWALALAVAAVAVWWVPARARVRLPVESAGAPPGRRPAAGTAVQRWRCLPPRSLTSVLLAVLATVAAVGTTVQVVHTGHLGAEATWGHVQQLPAPGG